jgi:ABC-2 type transport system permease protein
VRSYLALLSAQFRTLLQYRAAALAGLFTQAFFGMVIIMVYEGFYSSSTTTPPLTYAQVVTYTWLGQATLGLIPWNVDPEIRSLIRSGGVAFELLRPLDLYKLWFTRCLARRSAPTLLRALPMLALAYGSMGLQLPPTWACGLLWLAANLGALFLSAAFTTLLSTSLIWTVSGEGTNHLLICLIILCSGLQIPLPFYPAWLIPLLDLLPFRGLYDVPARLYLGHIPSSQALGVLAHQLLWTLALVALGRWVLARGLRRLEVQGG